jgi:hypothetical protein
MALAFTPEEALRRWCDPAAVKLMDDLSHYAGEPLITIIGGAPTYSDIMHQRYCSARGPLESFVIGELKAGRWTASALEHPVTLKSERTLVPAHFWSFLKLDFKAATAEGNQLKLVEIKIDTAPSTQFKDPNQDGSRQSNEEIVQLGFSDDDDAIFNLGGERLIFRGLVQQSILRQLVDAYYNDRELRTSEVLQKAGSEADSIAKAFRNNPHWPKLRQIIHQYQGFVWLDLRAPP